MDKYQNGKNINNNNKMKRKIIIGWINCLIDLISNRIKPICHRDNNLIAVFTKRRQTVIVVIATIVFFILPNLALAQAPVTISEVVEVIPTYTAGPPDPNPMFFFGRESQGAEGRIYPYPLYDNLTNVKTNKSYHVVYLENEYVRISILPEIGGRLFQLWIKPITMILFISIRLSNRHL